MAGEEHAKAAECHDDYREPDDCLSGANQAVKPHPGAKRGVEQWARRAIARDCSASIVRMYALVSLGNGHS